MGTSQHILQKRRIHRQLPSASLSVVGRLIDLDAGYCSVLPPPPGPWGLCWQAGAFQFPADFTGNEGMLH